ncbi:MAG: GNAT family N-acetyltransferase [Acidimicrobiia bacterium]|nr:GNAT family N-acetyltransferase [Acidimicrobiia bacterium]
MADPLAGPRATFVSGPDPAAAEGLADVVWFDIAGTAVGLRPIHPDDRDALLEGFLDMSDRSRYQRFLAPVDRLSDRQLAYLTQLDQINHFAWVAGQFDAEGELRGLGVARYVRVDDDPGVAELAVAVADAAQGKGIGTLLVEALLAVAEARGIRSVFGLLLAENEPMARIFRRVGAELEREDGGLLRATVDVPADLDLDAEAIDALVRVAESAADSAGSG